MIKDRIKFQPVYASREANGFAEASVEAENLAPERIWRNLCNISVWNRLNPSIEDIQPLDSSDNDPHLFDKMQFNYDLVTGEHIDAQVVLFQPPKDDRPGRLAYQATIKRDGKEINEMSVEFLIGVPDHKGKLEVEGALSYLYPETETLLADITKYLGTMLENVVKWSVKHN